MGFLVGASCGIAVQLYSNAVRKLPLMRHPWEHVLLAGIGGYAGYKFTQWEEDQRNELSAMLGSMNKFGRPSPIPSSAAAEKDE
eukprot:g5466.t1